MRRRRFWVLGVSVAFFLLALFVSLRQTTRANPVREAALTAFVRIVGHKTPVQAGMDCRDCHRSATAAFAARRKGP